MTPDRELLCAGSVFSVVRRVFSVQDTRRSHKSADIKTFAKNLKSSQAITLAVTRQQRERENSNFSRPLYVTHYLSLSPPAPVQAATVGAGVTQTTEE